MLSMELKNLTMSIPRDQESEMILVYFKSKEETGPK
jgi:hypothetical protein